MLWPDGHEPTAASERPLLSPTYRSSPGARSPSPLGTSPPTCSGRRDSHRQSVPEPDAPCEPVIPDNLCVHIPTLAMPFPLSPWLKPVSLDDTSRPSPLTLSPESACVSPSGLYLSTCQPGGEEPVPGAGTRGTHEAALTWFVEKAPELVLHVSLTLLQVLLLEARRWE